jgi:hypothetical protein
MKNKELTNSIKLTELEIDLLTDIVTSWHENDPDYTEYSIGHPEDEPMSNKLKGVLSSLVKKELVVDWEQVDEGYGVYNKVYPRVKGIVAYLKQYDLQFRIDYINRMSDLNGEQTEVRNILVK